MFKMRAQMGAESANNKNVPEMQEPLLERSKDKEEKMKSSISIALILFISVIASSSAFASGYSFFSYKPLLSVSTPSIISAELYPPKVKEGDVLLITAELNDVAGISSASAEIDTEAGKDRIKLHLTEGNVQSGIWRGHWIAHATKNQKWYNLSIYATNVFGRQIILDTKYFDPVQNHSASEVTAGTFDSGDYVFPNNLDIAGNLNVSNRINASAYSVGATAGWSGFYYINESIDSYTKLLSHFDGVNAATAYTDSIAGAYTFAGTAQLSTAQKVFGTASLLLDGNSDSVTLPDSASWAFGTGDFTIDFWFNTPDITRDHIPIQQRSDSDNYWMFDFYQSGGVNRVSVTFRYGAVTKGGYTVTLPTISNNVWYHFVFERVGTTAKAFLNGTSSAIVENTAFGTNDVGDISATLDIGRYGAGGANDWYGYIDEFRISKGIARWTSNFNVRNSPYGGDKTITVNNGIITGLE